MLIRELLLAADATIETPRGIKLQRLTDGLAEACDIFGLTISVKKSELDKGQTRRQR